MKNTRITNYRLTNSQQKLVECLQNGFTDLASFILILAVGVPLVYIVAKLLKLHPQSIEIAEKKKQAILSLTLFVVVFVIAFAILTIYAYVWVRPNLQEDPIYVFRDIFGRPPS